MFDCASAIIFSLTQKCGKGGALHRQNGIFATHGYPLNEKSAPPIGEVLSGEFENSAKCEHRICPDKSKVG